MNERIGDLVSGLLALSGVICLVGAAIARKTGDDLHLDNGSTFRTHQDAFLVLLVLGLVLLVNAVVVALVTQRDSD